MSTLASDSTSVCRFQDEAFQFVFGLLLPLCSAVRRGPGPPSPSPCHRLLVCGSAVPGSTAGLSLPRRSTLASAAARSPPVPLLRSFSPLVLSAELRAQSASFFSLFMLFVVLHGGGAPACNLCCPVLVPMSLRIEPWPPATRGVAGAHRRRTSRGP
ncbi:hypothetical protein TRVL_02576 [Trypanosoma vivax]|nr:hypothetical protein TRVL_02576 [Trypanosoma vivax]